MRILLQPRILGLASSLLLLSLGGPAAAGGYGCPAGKLATRSGSLPGGVEVLRFEYEYRIGETLISNLEDLDDPVVLEARQGTESRSIPVVLQEVGDSYVDIVMQEAPEVGSTIVVGGRLAFRDGWEDEYLCSIGLEGEWIVAEAPAPMTALGVLSVSYEEGIIYDKPDPEWSVSTRASIARVEVELDPSTLPWRDVLLYEIRVDGRAWMPDNTRGFYDDMDDRGEGFMPGGYRIIDDAAKIFSTCDTAPAGSWAGDYEYPGVAFGEHSVEIVGTVPGTDLAVTAGPLLIDIPPCSDDAAEEPAGRDAGSGSGSDAGSSMEVPPSTVGDGPATVSAGRSKGCALAPGLPSPARGSAPAVFAMGLLLLGAARRALGRGDS